MFSIQKLLLLVSSICSCFVMNKRFYGGLRSGFDVLVRFYNERLETNVNWVIIDRVDERVVLTLRVWIRNPVDSY
jgi:hypothetical protein